MIFERKSPGHRMSPAIAGTLKTLIMTILQGLQQLLCQHRCVSSFGHSIFLELATVASDFGNKGLNRACVWICLDPGLPRLGHVSTPVVPHNAVAEVSKIGNL